LVAPFPNMQRKTVIQHRIVIAQLLPYTFQVRQNPQIAHSRSENICERTMLHSRFETFYTPDSKKKKAKCFVAHFGKARQKNACIHAV
jgi:hypothetical protein